MKRVGGLYEQIGEPENLRLAFWKARRGKEGKPEVEEFRSRLDIEIGQLRHALAGARVAWGDYYRFTVHDPKTRTICAAPFRDRVLHHAIMHVCEPVFERYQVFDSYACRKGKGLHACLDRARQYTRRHAWYLKLDVRKYFDSISHRILLAQLRCRFKDERLMRLFESLLQSYQTESGHGIPIGNLTSQYFANQYLAAMDHRIREILRIPGYVRYMDDFVLWADTREALRLANDGLRSYCRDQLALELKPPILNRAALGVTMLGYRVFPHTVRLAKRSRRRFAVKLQCYWRKLQEGEWNQDDFAAHVLPLTAYAGHARSTGFRLAVMEHIGCSPQARTA